MCTAEHLRLVAYPSSAEQARARKKANSYQAPCGVHAPVSWEKMAVEEYAALQRVWGTRLVQRDGIWWRQVRPLFYMPLFPFQEFSPGSQRPPGLARIGGCQHLVPSPDAANSRMNFFVFAEPQDYSLEHVKHHRKQNIKKGLRHFELKEVHDLQEFIRAAYPVYLSFYSRTHYWYHSQRRDQRCFAVWAKTLFDFPKLLILGAWHEDALCAFHISYRVEDVLVLDTFFSHSDALHLRVLDVTYHALRERAAAVPDLQWLFLGRVSGKKGLDDSKLGRGAVVLSKPAFVLLNPLSRLALRLGLPGCYAKLLGQLPALTPRQPSWSRTPRIPSLGPVTPQNSTRTTENTSFKGLQHTPDAAAEASAAHPRR